MGLSNHLTTDIAPIPFLWILPLAVYLVTFILCFESDRWYERKVVIPAALLSILVFSEGSAVSPTASLPLSVGVSIFTLLTCAMVAHGELARLRPPAEDLARYYLYISLGGAIGGLCVGIGAPLCFNSLLEIPISAPLS